MNNTETFRIPLGAAEAYESKFVPALFAEWAPRVLDAAGIMAGQRVLDVACGTGIVARTAVDRVGPEGHVAGVDVNDAMLTVARRVGPGIDYRQGDAASLPFPDGSFDAVVCQMALMFFPDRVRAMTEMRRVARPGGIVAVAVPASLPSQPAYDPFVRMVARHAGPAAMSILSAYWICGDLNELAALVQSAGLRVETTRTVTGTARFASVDDFVSTEISSTPLGERLTEETYACIRDDARDVLRGFERTAGLEVPLVGHIVSALVP